MRNAGVYLLHNHRSGQAYVGKTCRLSSRWDVHLRQLRERRHPNPRLQKSYDETGGAEAFSFRILELWESGKDLDQMEYRWIKQIHPSLNGNGRSEKYSKPSPYQCPKCLCRRKKGDRFCGRCASKYRKEMQRAGYLPKPKAADDPLAELKEAHLVSPCRRL